MPVKAEGWTRTILEAGIRIRLYERGGVIYRDLVFNGRRSRKSLETTSRRDAERLARELARQLADGQRPASVDGGLTLGRLFRLYTAQKVPTLAPDRAAFARTRVQLFLRAWGDTLDVLDLSQSHVDRYVQARRSGRIAARRPAKPKPRKRGAKDAAPSPPPAPRGVTDGTLDSDFRWLSSVFNWARKERVQRRPLLAFNPLHGLEWPREVNVRRPVASDQRYRKTLEHVDRVDPAGRLRCMLALARYTGRRIGAICELYASDFLRTPDQVRAVLARLGLDERAADHMPHGAIFWRPDTDKMGFATVAPLGADARAALDAYLRQNPRVGDVPLFPSPQDPALPIRRDVADAWLRRAEKLAELPRLARGGWHAYRRLWAVERKHLPDVDVAAAGGWKDTRALKQSYQQPDPATILRAVMNAGSA